VGLASVRCRIMERPVVWRVLLALLLGKLGHARSVVASGGTDAHRALTLALARAAAEPDR
jgi:hypothetical protein